LGSEAGNEAFAKPPGWPTPYALFVGANFSWFLAVGIHQVMLSWLLVGVLGVGASWVGTVQMLGTLPILFFLLPAGLAADRFEKRSLLIVVQLLTAALCFALALLIVQNRLSIMSLGVYVFLWGTLQAFAQPARDSLISNLAATNLLRGVVALTLTQFAGLALGSRVAALGDWIGLAPTICLQASVLMLGTLLLLQLPRFGVSATAISNKLSWASVRAGLSEVARVRGLSTVTMLVAANGLFFNGLYLVLCPVVVRQVYGGSLADLSLVMMSLPVGSIVGSMAVFWRGRIQRKGLAFLISVLSVSACTLAIALQPPFWAFVCITFFWGIGHSIFFNMSRTMFQEAAPESHRARVLSIHPLAFMGMTPLSTLGSGLLADGIGPLETFTLAGIAAAGVTLFAWVRSPVRHM
jgi:MFS family permease